MLATSARRVPDSAFDWIDSSSGLKTTLSPSRFTSTPEPRRCDNRLSGPLTEIWPGAKDTSTPLGRVTGRFPMRDICSAPRPRLRHDAQHFAADAGLARLAVGHHTPGRGHDRHAQAVHHLRNVLGRFVDAQPRTADPLDALDHRAAGVIFQADLEGLLGTLPAQREVLDIAFILEDLGDRHLDFARRHDDRGFLRELCVADARQHVGNGITHAHPKSPATSLPWSRRESHHAWRSRAACFGPDRTCGTPRAGDLSASSD